MSAQTGALDALAPARRPSKLADFLRLARTKTVGSAAAIILLLAFAIALLAPVIAPYDPLEVNTSVHLQPPGGAHLLGTDELGRDLLSRVMYGARISLMVGISAVMLGTVFGIFLGITSAFFGGFYDLLVQRFIDSLQAFPSLVLALVMVATLGSSVTNVIMAIAITLVATKARVVRATTLSLMQNQYVDGARVIGCTSPYIMVKYILPNAWPVIIVLFSLSIGQAIIREASLSFLGLGPPPPTPTWGGMLSGSARAYMTTAPWLAVVPGICIMAVVLSFNLLGDTIRDVLDPRLRNTA